MKKLCVLIMVVVGLSGVYAVDMPDMNQMQRQAESAAKSAAELEALKGLVRNITPVQFKVGSSTLSLNDPSFMVAGYNVNDLMKSVVIPALSDIINKLPTDKKIAVVGHASSTGSEEGSGTFVGHVELSRQRAQAVVNYIRANSDLDAGKFAVVAKGSSAPLSGVNAADAKNCRVSFDIQ